MADAKGSSGIRTKSLSGDKFWDDINVKYRHFVFKDLVQHKDFSWYIQPVGFISSVVLFPSFVFCGLFTTIQESSLLDFKMTLEQNDKTSIVTRFTRLNDINFKLLHTNIAVDFVKRMATNPFIMKLSSSNTEEDNLATSMFYYKRYLGDAIDKELYIRNPLKYDELFPTTSFLAKLTVGGISAAFIIQKYCPGMLSAPADTVNSTKKTQQPKNCHNATVATLKTINCLKGIIGNRMRLIMVDNKCRNRVLRVVMVANVLNVLYWGLETRQ